MRASPTAIVKVRGGLETLGHGTASIYQDEKSGRVHSLDVTTRDSGEEHGKVEGTRERQEVTRDSRGGTRVNQEAAATQMGKNKVQEG